MWGCSPQRPVLARLVGTWAYHIAWDPIGRLRRWCPIRSPTAQARSRRSISARSSCRAMPMAQSTCSTPHRSRHARASRSLAAERACVRLDGRAGGLGCCVVWSAVPKAPAENRPAEENGATSSLPSGGERGRERQRLRWWGAHCWDTKKASRRLRFTTRSSSVPRGTAGAPPDCGQTRAGVCAARLMRGCGQPPTGVCLRCSGASAHRRRARKAVARGPLWSHARRPQAWLHALLAPHRSARA